PRARSRSNVIGKHSYRFTTRPLASMIPKSPCTTRDVADLRLGTIFVSTPAASLSSELSQRIHSPEERATARFSASACPSSDSEIHEIRGSANERTTSLVLSV